MSQWMMQFSNTCLIYSTCFYRTAVKDRIVSFLLFLGKVAITGLVGVFAYIGFSGFLDLGTSLWGRPLNYYLLPIMVKD